MIFFDSVEEYSARSSWSGRGKGGKAGYLGSSGLAPFLIGTSDIVARLSFIDDDVDGRQMAAYNLRAPGHEIEEADNGRGWFLLFSPDSHDLVITDLRMPKLSGIEVTRQIHECAKDTLVLSITAMQIERPLRYHL